MTDPHNIDDSVAAAAVFRTLSDPYRLHMYVVLRGMCVRGDEPTGTVAFADAIDQVACSLNMSPGLAEQHLMELARARLVVVEDDEQGRPIAKMNVALLRKVSDIMGCVKHHD